MTFKYSTQELNDILILKLDIHLCSKTYATDKPGMEN